MIDSAGNQRKRSVGPRAVALQLGEAPELPILKPRVKSQTPSGKCQKCNSAPAKTTAKDGSSVCRRCCWEIGRANLCRIVFGPPSTNKQALTVHNLGYRSGERRLSSSSGI